MTEKRVEHPYHMYEAILAQPEAFGRTAERSDAEVGHLADELASCRRLFLIGIGTSLHAALVGEHLVREYGGGVDVRAVHSFDFALYGPRLTPEDGVVAVSHRGTKRYTAQALARAREAGCPTAVISGEEGTPESTTDVVLRTVAQEPSSAHTVSFTAAVSVLANLAAYLGMRHTGERLLGQGFLQTEFPVALRQALQTEEEVEALAHAHANARRIWIVGGGPAATAAVEATLKIKETSYLQAEGLSTEQMLHGPFQCVESEDMFVLVAPTGAAQERIFDLARAIRKVGAPYLVVGDGTAEALAENSAGQAVVPEVAEPFSALTCLIPLQLFAYHLAVVKGTNPDDFRAGDPRFAGFQELVGL